MISDMLRLDAAIARPAVKQHGLATREQLRQLGMSDDGIDNRIEAGLLRRTPFRGVLHHAATPFTERTRLLAPILAVGPNAAASHRSSAVLHRYDGIRRFRPEITVCDTTMPKLAGVTVHRTDTLDAIDRCVIDGVPATGGPRTCLDLGAVLPFEVIEHVVQVAIIEKRLSELDLIAVLDRLGKPGRRGTASLRAIVHGSIPDERLQSMLEHELHTLILHAGVPLPELQYELVCADGTVVVLDFAWPALRLGVEAHGLRWHATRAQLERDLKRTRSVQATGWNHYAYGWGDVRDRAAGVIAELKSLFVALTVP